MLSNAAMARSVHDRRKSNNGMRIFAFLPMESSNTPDNTGPIIAPPGTKDTIHDDSASVI